MGFKPNKVHCVGSLLIPSEAPCTPSYSFFISSSPSNRSPKIHGPRNYTNPPSTRNQPLVEYMPVSTQQSALRAPVDTYRGALYPNIFIFYFIFVFISISEDTWSQKLHESAFDKKSASSRIYARFKPNKAVHCVLPR